MPGLGGETSHGENALGCLVHPLHRALSESRFATPLRQGSSVERERRSIIVLLLINSEVPPHIRLGKPRPPLRAEAVTRLIRLPRQGNTTSVTTGVGPLAPKPHRILASVVGKIENLRQPEFLTLVEVRRARQPEKKHGGGQGSASSALVIDDRRLGDRRSVLGRSKSGRMPNDVVVAEHPRWWGTYVGVIGNGRIDGLSHALVVPSGCQVVEVE